MLEAELNTLFSQAYGLDEDDIRVIEAHLAGKLTSRIDTSDEIEDRQDGKNLD